MTLIDDDRILSRCRVKLASIMSEVMPEDQWLAKTLEQQREYVSKLPLGEIQLLADSSGVAKPFANGLESDVYKALVNPASVPEGIGDIKIKDIPSIVVKKPRLHGWNKFMMLGDEALARRDVLSNPANRDLFPWHSFDLAGEGNVVSEWVGDMFNSTSPMSEKIKMLKDLQVRMNNMSTGKPSLWQQISKLVPNFFWGNNLDMPIVKGNSGIEYLLGDVNTDVVSNQFHNIGQSLDNKAKIIDFFAEAKDPGFINKLKMLFKRVK